jgi:hypothetical protein
VQQSQPTPLRTNLSSNLLGERNRAGFSGWFMLVIAAFLVGLCWLLRLFWLVYVGYCGFSGWFMLGIAKYF